MVLLATVACGGADAPTAPPVPTVDACTASLSSGVRSSTTAGVSTWAVLPVSTDLCITQALDSHYVYRAAAVAPVGKLLVFLPGTGAIAAQYQLILAQAARAGYHAVGISYPNSEAIGVLCATQPTNCYGDARLEVVTGQASSSVVAVNRANSIENRLIKLLRFMRSTEPAGNWGQFLTGDTAVLWSKISIAGHSQGGGHALFIAQRYSVGRATAYGSYGDGLPGNAGPAPWVTRPYATPTSRIVGFISAFDEIVVPLQAFSAWSAIGLTGAVVDVDENPPPFGAAQRFFTNAAPANRLFAVSPNHNLVVLDLNTPKVGTTPVFADIWRALSFP